jgi:hypothetical protein
MPLKRESGFNLSLEEFVGLMNEANVGIDDLHIKGYHLSRYNDSGDYVVGNCRFIPCYENIAEKKVSDAWRDSSRRNIANFNESLTDEDRKERAKKIAETRRINGTTTLPDNELTDDEIQRRISIINSYPKVWGWVMKCSAEIGISHTQLRRFCKIHGINY